jgi:hypothetical protein
MEISAQAALDADTRRAQGFFLLHEGIQHKEMQEVATATVSSSKEKQRGHEMVGGVRVTRKSQRVRATANAELERLQGLPTGSYKWTWGPQLTDAEAIALLGPPGEPVLPHSGYDTSLPDGGYERFPHSPPMSMPGDSNRVSPLMSDREIPPLSNFIPTIDLLAHRNAEMDPDDDESGSEFPVLGESAGDLGLVWGATDDAGEAPVNQADADSDDSVRDLAAKWGTSGDAGNHAGNDADADSDESAGGLGLVWGGTDGAGEAPANQLHADSVDSVRDLVARCGMSGDAVNNASNDAEADSDESAGDLGRVWGARDGAEEAPVNEAEGDSDVSAGDLAWLWGDRDHTVAQGLNNSKDSSDESGGDLGVTWGKGVDADAGAGPASHGPPPSDPTTGLTEVSPTKVTLTAQPFTALDFDYLDPSWLEPASEPPPFDGDDEEESDDSEDDASTGYTGGSDGEGDSEPI